MINDVFPRRNLGKDADLWGRTAEDHLVQTSARQDVIRDELNGLNRTLSSSLETISRQITDIEDQSSLLASQVEDLEEQTLELQVQVGRIPVTDVLNASATNFSVGSTYATKTSLTVPAVTGKQARIFVLAEMVVEETDVLGFPEPRMRLVVGGVNQTALVMIPAGYGLSSGAGNSYVRSTSFVTTLTVSTGVTIDLQSISSVPAMTPARAANYAILNATVTYMAV